jgi:hypothetical protein
MRILSTKNMKNVCQIDVPIKILKTYEVECRMLEGIVQFILFFILANIRSNLCAKSEKNKLYKALN